MQGISLATAKQVWRCAIKHAAGNFSKGVNPVKENKLSRKWHLTSIKEWLDLAQAPLLRAQRQVGDALNELCQNHDTVGGVSGTEIAHTVNMGVVRVMHAQDLVELALTQLEQPSEPTLPSEIAPLPPYYCDLCERTFRRDYGVAPGCDCPFCADGVIRLAFPESEGMEPPIDKDNKDHDIGADLVCTGCDYSVGESPNLAHGDNCPVCSDGKVYRDGIPF